MEIFEPKPLFEQWEDTKLLVRGYPTPVDVDTIYKDFDVFLNVSDEYWMNYVSEIWSKGKQSHWFPLGEIDKNIGMSSIYGALWVLYQAHERNLSVLLHCHAGVNRSQTVRACFYYMMTGEHLNLERSEKHPDRSDMNMLHYNYERNHLPAIAAMELWIKACKEAFDDPNRFIGGMYDWTLRQAGLQEL